MTIRRKRPRKQSAAINGKPIIPLTRAQYVRYMWWVIVHLCADCGGYHLDPN